MRKEILKYLKEKENEFISGEDISNRLSITRASVWKHIKALKEEGYEIDSISRRGYRLVNSPDILTYEEVEPLLTTKEIGRKIIYYKTIDSTNSECKRISGEEKEGTVIISEEQSKGRGRLGRAWVSPSYKGIFMSILLKPDIDMAEAPKITGIGAAAVFSGLKEMGIDSKIKWPNDLTINGKKICGILTEMSGEINKINYIVLGIGINVNLESEDIPTELIEVATSIKIEEGINIKRKTLLAYILNKFEELYEEFLSGNNSKTVNICRENSTIIGKEINVIKNGDLIRAKALDIDEEGALIVKYENGNIAKVISGEVSIRGINSYS